MADQNQFDQAIEYIDKAVTLTPDNPKLKILREQILESQRLFEVKKRVGRATEFLDEGDMNSARKEFQAILTILPGESVQE